MNNENQSPVDPINIVEAIRKVLTKPLLHLRKPRHVVTIPKDSSEEKLTDIAIGVREILITANTVFPFVLFPNTITLDRQKLTIIHREFFRTANTISLQIDDILNVESNVGLIFGSLHLYSKYFVNDVKTIDFLWRSDILKVQRLIQGSSIASRRRIDCTNIEKDQLITLLNTLGQTSEK
jgi:hypothetical protein